MALQRAFQNLIFNAVKYGGCAEVSLEAAEEVIAISVKDQGPGIPTEQLEEVMKPFYRLDGSRNPDTGGVGLGLAIVRNVLQAHGGNLVLSNHPQGGLIALVTLPLSASTD